MPEAATTTIHILWARSDRYKIPQFVTAWPDGLVDSWHEWYLELREKAIREYMDFGDESDGPWMFWMGVQRIEQPTSVASEPIKVPA